MTPDLYVNIYSLPKYIYLTFSVWGKTQKHTWSIETKDTQLHYSTEIKFTDFLETALNIFIAKPNFKFL